MKININITVDNEVWRDIFAAAALSGISGHVAGPAKREHETNAEAHARWAYKTADAMLKERSKL